MADRSLSPSGRARSSHRGAGTPGGTRDSMSSRSPAGSRLSGMLATDMVHGQEVEGDMGHAIADAKANRFRVEALREELRKFERVTADNAKEIKALRAERFGIMQGDGESQPFPTVQFQVAQEDQARAAFSVKSHPVPHTDLRDLDEPHLAPPSAVGVAMSPAHDRIEPEAGHLSDEDSDVECLLRMQSKWDCDALGPREEGEDEGDRIETLRPWVASVFPPKGKHPKAEGGGRWRLLLERVHGQAGGDKSNVLVCLASGEVAYPAGCVVVVASGMDGKSPAAQRFFTQHENEVAALCLHPDGTTVASADVGVGSRVCVWSSDPSGMDCLARPMEGEESHPRGVRAMCFSKDGRHLVTVGADSGHQVALSDWRTGQVLCKEEGDRNPIVEVRCNPHDGCLVTVGRHHVKFWQVKVSVAHEQLPAQAGLTVWRRTLEGKRGVFGRHASARSRTLLCVDFVGPGMSVTGGGDGSFLLWKGVMVTSAIAGHDGPLVSMWALDGQGVTRVATGGKDGKLKLWVIDARAVLRPCVTTAVVPGGSVRSVCWDESSEDVYLAMSDGSTHIARADAGFRVEPAAAAHRGGSVHAVAAHPTRPVYASGGADGQIVLWHAITGKALSRLELDPAGVRSLAYAHDGLHLAAGLASGGVHMVAHDNQADRLSKVARYGQAMKAAVRVVRFSPAGDLIAIGTDKGKVEVVDAPALRKRVGAYGGHRGAVTHVDWSRDGKLLASNSDTYELQFWGAAPSRGGDSKEGFKQRLPAACADVDWATWTCNLGWPVQGLHSEGGDELAVTSVDRAQDRSVVAAGGASGAVRVAAYPCLSQGYLRDTVHLHVGGTACVAFLAPSAPSALPASPGGLKPGHVLVSSGSRDGCLMEFSVIEAPEGWSRPSGQDFRAIETFADQVQESEPLPAELIRIIDHSKAAHASLGGAPTVKSSDDGGSTVELLEAAGPFLSNLCPPSSHEENLKPPDWELSCTRVQGVEGHRLRSCARLLGNGKVVYAAGHMVVVQGRETKGARPARPQVVMRRHTARVQSLCVHPDGETVASVQEGPPGTVLLWSSESLQLLASLENGTNGVSAMCFSPDGSVLYAASNGRNQPLSAWTWQKSKLAAREEIEPEVGKVLIAVAASPHEEDAWGGQLVVVVGSGIVRFWKHDGGRMRGRAGETVRDLGVHTSVAFGEPGVTFTGTNRGEVWMWRDNQHLKTQPLHDGPVYDLSSNFELGQLATGGHDGLVQLVSWDLDPLVALPLEEHAAHMVCCSSQRGGVITSIDWSSHLDSFLVATAGCELIELSYSDQDGPGEAFVHAQAHSGTVTSLCTHPQREMVASAGSEGTVRLWETDEEATPLAIVQVEEGRHVTSVDMQGKGGEHVTVGMSDGSIEVWLLSSMQGVVEAGAEEAQKLRAPGPQFESRRKRAITCLRYSPCGRFLAAGNQDSLIDLFDAKARGEAMASCKGHFGTVTEIDWESNGDHMKSTSTSHELMFWDAPSCELIRNPLALRDLKWSSGTCRFSWETLAAVPPGDESALMAVCRSSATAEGGACFAAGFEGGNVKLYRHPAPSRECGDIAVGAGLSCVSHVAFAPKDDFLWAAGGEDGALLLFRARFFKPFPSTTVDIDLVLEKPLSRVLHQDLALAALPDVDKEDQGFDMGAVKPYLQNVFGPSKPPKPPPASLLAREMVLEHVYGYRGHDTRGNMVSLASGEVAYPAMGLVVLSKLEDDVRNGDHFERRKQRFFRKHAGDVTCLAAHPDGTRVASADVGVGCSVLVWEVQTLGVDCTLAGFKEDKRWVADSIGISAIAFGGKGGKYIVTLGMGDGLVAALYEWEQSRMLSSVSTGAQGLLGVAVHPSAPRFVTVGVKHVAFWEMGKSRITGESGVYGKVGTERTMVCGVFAPQKGSSELKYVTLTGSIDGSVFVWVSGILAKVVACHKECPIMDMWLSGSGSSLVTGGADGEVWMWSFDQDDVRLAPLSSKDVEGGCCVRAVCALRTGSGIIVGSSDGQISFVGMEEAAKIFTSDLSVTVSGHAAADITALCCHPAESDVFVTASKDGTVRMWESKIRAQTSSQTFRLPISEEGEWCTCIDLVPSNGLVLACGMSNGGVVLVDIDGPETITRDGATSIDRPGVLTARSGVGGDEGIKATRMGLKVECVRFGMCKTVEDGKDEVLLAVAGADSVIDLYKLFEEREMGVKSLVHIGGCRGHSPDLGSMKMEWDENGWGLVSACGCEELVFWDLKPDPKRGGRRPLREMRAVEARDANWTGWSLKLGWPVRGVVLEGQEESIVGVHAAKNLPVCAVAKGDGDLELYRFPCPEVNEPLSVQTKAHAYGVKCVGILRSDQTVVSAGARDGTLAQWHLQRPDWALEDEQGLEKSTRDACLDAAVRCVRQVRVATEEGGRYGWQPTDVVKVREDQEFVSSFHPYLAAIHNIKDRPDPTDDDLSPPEDELKLEFVLGYNAEMCGNMHALKSGELLYGVARVCVVLNITGGRRTQKLFTRHKRDVTALAVHPDGLTVASGELGEWPVCYVWSSRTLAVLATLTDYYTRSSLASLCFNQLDGSILSMVGSNSKGSTVAFFEWSLGAVLAENDKFPFSVLAVRSSPITGSYVTVGDSHICFWRLAGRNLTKQSCALPDDGEMVCAIEFVGSTEKEAVVATGGQSGDVMLWRDGRLGLGPKQHIARVSAVSSGPVFGLAATPGGGLLSGGKGGTVRRWHIQRSEREGREYFKLVDGGAVPVDLASVLTDTCPSCGDKACVRGIRVIKGGGLVFCLGSGVLCEIGKGWESSEGEDVTCSILMEGHTRDGPLSLAWHPSLPLVVTCCSDGTVKLWNREMRRAVSRAVVSDPTVVTFSADGSLVLVGTGSGKIAVLEAETLVLTDQGTLEAGKKSISALCFSPNGRLLAAASNDACIRVFGTGKKGLDGGLTLKATCKGSSGGVVAVDWSADSMFLMSNTDTLDMNLWQIPAEQGGDTSGVVVRPAGGPERHSAMNWSTNTCMLGWHTQALLHPVADLTLLLCGMRSRIGSIFAVGDSHGRVKIYRFPCPDKGMRGRTYLGHSDGVACVGFSSDDRHVASGGVLDRSLFLWQHRIVPPSDEDDPDVASVVRKCSVKHSSSSSTGDAQTAVAPTTVEGEIEEVRPYFSAIFPPSKVSGEDARGDQGPEDTLEIEHVHGYRGFDCANNLLYLSADELVFTSGAVVVLHRINDNRQRIFSEHTDDISAISLHPSGRMLATAQISEGSVVLVWDTRHLSVAAKLVLPKGCSPSALAFSTSGENLVVVGTGIEENICVFDWMNNKRLAMETAGTVRSMVVSSSGITDDGKESVPSLGTDARRLAAARAGTGRILAVSCHPDERTIVTCGVRNVTFWTMQKGHLNGREATGGGSKKQTFLCIGFSSDALTLTGAQNGCIYVWRGSVLDKTVVAHRGPVMDMAVTFDGLVTAGKDGIARLWDYDLTASVRIDVGELTQGMLAGGEGVTSVRAVACLMEAPEEEGGEPRRRIAIGMSSNRVVQLIYSHRPHDLDAMPEVRLVGQGHAGKRVTCLCTHPFKQLFATSSTDGTVRLWDCDHKCGIASIVLPKAAHSMTFSTDGNSLIMGSADGNIVAVETENIEGQRKVIVSSRLNENKAVRVLRFSLQGGFLAAGLMSGFVHVYDAAQDYALVCTLKHSTGSITAIDWTADGSFLQCTTLGYDLCFWDLRDHARPKQLFRSADVCDLTFPHWTCTMGWPVQGAASDATHLSAATKALKGTNMAIMHGDGTLSLVRYPLLKLSAPRLQFQGHSPGPGHVAFTAGDKRVVTIGGSDMCVIQWRVMKPITTPGTSVAGSVADAEEARAEFERRAAARDQNRWHWGLVRLTIDLDMGDWTPELEEELLVRVAKVARITRAQVGVAHVLAGSVVATVSVRGIDLAKVYRLLEDDVAAGGKLVTEHRVRGLVCDVELRDMLDKFRSPLSRARAEALGRGGGTDRSEKSAREAKAAEEEGSEEHEVKPYLSGMVPPESYKVKAGDPPPSAPELELHLETIHAFGAHDMVSNLGVLKSGEIVFGAVSVGVVMNPATGRQHFFRGHLTKISAIATHPDGVTVATGDMGSDDAGGCVHVWCSETLELLASLPRVLPGVRSEKVAPGAVSAMCFSKDGSKLMVADTAMVMWLFDWRRKGSAALVSTGKADKDGHTVLASGSNPYDDANEETFVTCGVDHLKFWSARGGQLRGTGWLGDPKGKGKLQTMLCLGFVERSMTIVGTQDGSIFIFRNSNMLRCVQHAHLGSVYCMDVSRQHVVTGGADGVVTRWRVEGKTGGSADLSVLKSNTAADLVAGKAGKQEGAHVSVKSVRYRGAGAGSRASSGLLVGTSGNSLYEVDDVTSQSRELVGGHCLGRVTGVSEHPTEGHMFATCGEDSTVRVWTQEKASAHATWRLGAPATCLQFAPDGKAIAVGLLRGGVDVVSFDGMRLELRPEQPVKRKKAVVSDVQYTPSGHFLAAGLTMGYIDLFDVLDDYSLRHTFKGHVSGVTRIDFDCAGRLMRSTSETLELLYWDIDMTAMVKNIAKIRNVTWDTGRCTLAWHARGVVASLGDGDEKAVTVTETGSTSARLRSGGGFLGGAEEPIVMAAGSIRGELRLLRYPCNAKDAGHRSTAGHSSAVSALAFSSDGEKIISAGGSDLAVLVWKIGTTAFPAGVDGLLKRPERACRIAAAFPQNLIVDDPLKGRLPLECQTLVEEEERQLRDAENNQLDPPQPVPPDNELELSHVFGYRGSDSNANIAIARSGDVVYVCGTVCAALDAASGAQETYVGHTNDVSCLAMHPDGIHVATGEAGPSPCLRVWECESQRTIAVIDASYLSEVGAGDPGHRGFQNGVLAACFSPSGDRIVAVGGDAHNTIFLIDWLGKEVLQAVRGGAQRVTACAWSVDDTLATVGVNHVKIWAFKERRLPARSSTAVMGKLKRQTTMLCVAHVSIKHVQETFHRALTITGGIEGTVFAFGKFSHAGEWRPELLAECVTGHEGPVFDVRTHELTAQQRKQRQASTGADVAGAITWLVTGGQDGLVKVWEVVARMHPKDKGLTMVEIEPLQSMQVIPSPTIGTAEPISHVKAAPTEEGEQEDEDDFDDEAEAGKQTIANPDACAVRSLCPSGKHVAVGTAGNRVVLVPWDLGAEQRTLNEGHELGRVRCVAVHPSMQVCATVADDGCLRLWDIDDRKCLVCVPFKSSPRACDISPDGLAVAVGLADGSVEILHANWSLDEPTTLQRDRRILGEKDLGVSCLRYSQIIGNPPKVFLAVGTDKRQPQPPKDGEKPSESMQFGGEVTVYDATSRYAFIEVAQQDLSDGHKGDITSFDWSEMPEGLLMSCCSRGRAAFWGPLPSLKRETSLELLTEISWSSWTSRLGTAVKGLHTLETSGAFIASVDRSQANTGKVLAVALRSGRIALASWPFMREAHDLVKVYPGSAEGMRDAAAHSREPCAVRFSYQDRYVVSAGGTDLCVAVWRHQDKKPPQDVILDALLSRVSHGIPVEPIPPPVGSAAEEAHAKAEAERKLIESKREKYVRSLAPALPPPFEWKQAAPKHGPLQLQPPERVLQLEHVYGYRGHDCGRNARFVQSIEDVRDKARPRWGGEVVYHVGKIGVVYDTTEASDGQEAGIQRYFEEHHGEISCMDVSPDGIKAATGETGGRSVLVWRMRDLAVLGSLVLPNSGGAAVVCFSASDPVGPYLLVVGADSNHTVSVFEWQKHQPGQAKFKGPGKPLAERAGDKRAVLAAACSDDNVWVTVGDRHIKFWRLEVETAPASKGRKERAVHKLEFTRGVWGSRSGRATVLVSVAIVGALTVAGAQDGSMYFFRDTKVVKVVAPPGAQEGARTTPLFDVARVNLTGIKTERKTDSVIATGCKDGNVRFWSVFDEEAAGGEEDGARADAEDNESEDSENPSTVKVSLLAECDMTRCASHAQTAGLIRTSHSAVAPGHPVGMVSVSIVEKINTKNEIEQFLLCGTSTDELLLTKLKVTTGKLDVVHGPIGTRVLGQSHFLGKVQDVAVHPAHPLFATCGDDKTVRVWSAKDKSMLSQGVLPEPVTCLMWSPRESIDHPITAGMKNGTCAVLVYKIGKHEMQFNLLPEVSGRDPYSITCLKYSPDARYVAVGGSSGFVDIFDAAQAYNRVGMCKAPEYGALPLRSIQWSDDQHTLMTETMAHTLLFWDVTDAANQDCQQIVNSEAMSKELWASWASMVGWPVQGVHEGCHGRAHVRSVDTRASYAGIGRLKIIPGDKDGVNLAAVGDSDGTLRLLKFPVLSGAKDHRERMQGQASGHGTEVTRVRFSGDGHTLFVACGANLAVLQYKVLHPSEVGQSGKMLKALEAGTEKVTKLDREMFWKVTVAELDEMRRRGMPADALHVREPMVKQMREMRYKVIDWTFERLELRVIGMDWRQHRYDATEADENVLCLPAGCTWKQMLTVLQTYFNRRDQEGKPLGVTFMYEKYEVAVPLKGRQEMCEKMLSEVLFKAKNQAEIEKIKEESRRTYSVKSELEYRQLWHYCEEQYRELVSAGVPFEGQAFRLDAHMIAYHVKPPPVAFDGSDTVAEQTEGESDVEEVLQAMPLVSTAVVDETEEDEEEVPKDPEPLAPTGWDQLAQDRPEDLAEREGYAQWRLDMAYADGYDGRNSRMNLHYARGGDMVYPTGALCVVHQRSTNAQKIFVKHAPHKISCTSMHPQGELVASGEIGPDPRVFVWSAHTMQVTCQISGLQPKMKPQEDAHQLPGGSKQFGGVASASFACGGDPWLVVVTGDEANTVSLVDYKQQTVIADDTGGRNKILAVVCSPHDRAGQLTFVTVGVRHVRFWTHARGRISSKKGLFSGVPQASRTMLCAAYTDPSHETARPEITLTGSKDGKVYVWKENKAVKVFTTFEGPLFSMRVVGDQIACGGKDKQAPLRVLALPRGWPAQTDLVQRAGMHPDKDGHARAGAQRSLCIRAIAWKGAEILVGTAESNIYVVDPRTQQSKLAVRGHCGGAVTGIAPHPTKELLCSVGEDGLVRLWDTQQKVSAQYRHLRQQLTAVAFHPLDGRHIAVGMRSGELSVLQSVTLQEAPGLDKDVSFGRCEEHSTYRRAAVHALRYSPDARFLALAVQDGLIDIQDVEQGYRHVRSVQGHWAGVLRLDWGRDSGQMGQWTLHSSGERGELRHWRLTIKPGGKDGRGPEVMEEAVEAHAARDEQWDTWTLPIGWPVTGAHAGLLEEGEEEGKEGEVGAVWHHGDVLLSAAGRKLRLFRWPCFSLAARFKEYAAHASPLTAVAGRTGAGGAGALISTGGRNDGGCIVHWNLVKLEKRSQGRWAAGGGGEGGDGDDAGGKGPGAGARNLSPFVGVSHDFKRVCAVTTDAEVTVFRADLDQGSGQAQCRHAAHRESVNGCCFSPATSESACSASSDREAHAWSAVAPEEGEAVADARMQQRMQGHQRDVIACAFSPDGKRVATASLDRTLLLWDVSGVAAQQLLAKGAGHRKAALCCAWSDDGGLVASGSEDKTVRVWRVPDGLDSAGGGVELETALRIKGHDEAVVFCAFAPRGTRPRLVSASLDETVRVWDTETGDELASIPHPTGLIGASFSHSGFFVATLALDNSVRLFDVSGGGASQVDDNLRSPMKAGSVGGGAFRLLDNGQEVLVVAEVRPPSTLVLEVELYLPAPESDTV